MSDIQELVTSFGTPLYRYDLAEVRAAAGELRSCLPAGARLFYSVKANPHPVVLATLRDEVAAAEVSSGGELTAACEAGFAPELMLYTGPGKSADELRHAMRLGVRHFSSESLQDLHSVVRVADGLGLDSVRCLLRVGRMAGGAGADIRMGGRPSQFGFDADDAASWAPRALDIAGDLLDGLHFFTVSNVTSADLLLGEITANMELAVELSDAYGLPLAWLDIGGGFAAPYAVPGGRPDYTPLRDQASALYERLFSGRASRPTLAFESGRFLVGAAGKLVARAVDVKYRGGQKFVVLDAGINHLGGMSGLRRIMPMSARAENVPDDAERGTLVGPLCTPADILGRDVPTGDADVMVIPNVGAYGLSASLVAFLSRELPAEVVVDAGTVVSATRLALERRAAVAVAAPQGSPDSPVDIARSVVDEIATHAGKVDAEAVFPVESVAALRHSGLMGLLVPRRFGGLGADLRSFVEVIKIIGGACGSTAMILAMHCQQVDAVVRHAGEPLRADLLTRIAAGELYLASITSEQQTGGHLLTSAAPLVADGDRLRIERDAPVVTGGAHADGFLITMLASPTAAPTEVSLVFAERSQLDITSGGTWDPLGMRATHSTGLQLRGSVPATQLIGRAGEFRAVAVESFAPLGHIGWAAAWLGIAQSALSALVRQLRGTQRPKSIDLGSDLVAERLARARIDLEAVSAYLRRTLDEVEDRRTRAASLDVPHVQIHLNTLKVLAAELSFASIDRTLQLAGLRLGYMRDSPLPIERAFRDLRSAALNYANDRLLRANGVLQLTDRDVSLI